MAESTDGTGGPEARSIPALPILCAVCALCLIFGASSALAAGAPEVKIDPTFTAAYTTAEVSGEVNAHEEFVEYDFELSTDGGASFDKHVITSGSPSDNVRPVVPRHGGGWVRSGISWSDVGRPYRVPAISKEQVRVLQDVGRCDLRRDDALGIACAATVDRLIVLAASEIGRHRIHMRREDNLRPFSTHAGIHIEAIRGGPILALGGDVHLLYGESPRTNKLRQKCADSPFAVGRRIDVDELSRQLHRIERHVRSAYLSESSSPE